jgi:hypothetical protein
MTAIERVRLNREDFVTWLGKALSGAHALPRSSSSTAEKPTDVILVAPRNQMDAWPIVCIPQAQMHDLFAFVSTYTKVRPFTAFFRVLPLEYASFFESAGEPVRPNLSLAKCVAGAAMAEAWIASARESERPKNVYPLLLASLSSALGQAVLAAYEQDLGDWIAREWVELRKQPSDPFRTQDIDGTTLAWKIMGSAIRSTKTPLASAKALAGKDAELVLSFLTDAIASGTIKPAMLRVLTNLSSGINLETLLAASREDRINRFNEAISEFKRRSDRGLRSEFVAGLMLAIAGNGSFDLLRSAREFDGWLDGATTWFGICAALFEESNLLTYGNSAGRRLVRDIMVRGSPFDPPRADINSCEYRFLSFGEAVQATSHAPNSLDVELAPGVLSRISSAPTENSDQRRDQAEMLLRSLDEASYLVDRARQAALGLTDGERQGSLYKPSRKTRPR